MKARWFFFLPCVGLRRDRVARRGAARDRVAVAEPGPKEYAGEATRQRQVRLGQGFALG